MTEYKTSEKQRAYAREYRHQHAAELQAYRDQHREKMRDYNQAYQIANREKLRAKSTRYFDEHPGYRTFSFKRWADANKDKILVRRRKYDKEKRQSDPLYRLQTNLRARIHQAIKTKKQPSGRTMKSTGCTIEFLKGWLESRWLPGMSWDNYGNRGWHVDHIIPCDAFDLSDLEQQRQCFHYSNLQPLWAPDNLKKSNFVGDGTKPKKNPGNGELQATREPNLHSAANKPEGNKA